MRNQNAGNLSCLGVAAAIGLVILFTLFSRTKQAPNVAPPQMVFTGTAQNQFDGMQIPITLQTSETYYDIAQSVSDHWREQGGADSPLSLLPKEGSRTAMQHILSLPPGSSLPDLWLTSSKALIDDLVSASGSKFVNRDDSSQIGLLPPQPLVFLVKKSKQAELDAYLTQENPLAVLPKGKFHFACADLLKSGGGDSASQYLKWAYRDEIKTTSGKPLTFEAYLSDLKAKGFEKRLEDSGPLASEFAQDTRLDFILVHNTLADREFLRANGTLYKVVPKKTVFETPAIVALKSGMAKHGDRLTKFIQFFTRNSALPSLTGTTAIEDPGDVNREKRLWEKSFNGGKRL